MRRPSIFQKLIVFSICFFPIATMAQSPFSGLENLFTTPSGYVVHHTNTPPVIDGDLNDKAWVDAQWTEQFQDIEGDAKPRPYLQTQVKMLWDDSCLYIAAKMQEPNVWAYVKNRDEIVFHDNDFEVFINPKNTTHQYYEFEVNAINTIFDLFLNKPYRDWGDPMNSWNAEGLRTAVKVDGTVNDAKDTDKGWTIEMAIPFKALYTNYINRPNEGAIWRINFSRVEWDTKVVNGRYVKEKDENGNLKPEHNWVWSPQGVINMHYPERWGYLQFARKDTGNTFHLPYAELQKQYLWLVYYREREWEHTHLKFMLKLKQMGLKGKVTINGCTNTLKLEATEHQFMALITDETDGITWTINREGLIQRLYNPKLKK